LKLLISGNLNRMKVAPQQLSHVSIVLIAFCALVTPTFAQKVVFAHFMLANQDYVPDGAPDETVIASYQREIRQAQAIGIDGFALNAGGWFKEPRYIKRASEMFEAAYRLNSNFKLMFSADMCCSNDADDVEDMVRRFANSPRYETLYYRRGDKVLLTTFAGERRGPGFWLKLRRDLEQGSNPSTRDAPTAIESVSGMPSSKSVQIFLVPAFFWGGELPQKIDIETGLSDYADIIDGAFYWGIAAVPGLGHPPDQIRPMPTLLCFITSARCIWHPSVFNSGAQTLVVTTNTAASPECAPCGWTPSTLAIPKPSKSSPGTTSSKVLT
jgi:glucan endo-1,3-alpha-glucosidase